MKKVEKVNIAIIIILTGVLCLFAGYVMFTEVMKVNDNSNSKGNSSEKVSKSSISFDDKLEIDKLIGTGYNGLSFLLSKDNINDMDNNDKLYYVYKEYLSDTYNHSEGVTFTKQDMKKAFEKSVLSELNYTDSDIEYSNYGNSIVIWNYDNNSGTYSYNQVGLGGVVTSTNIVYTYNIDSYVKDNKYVVVNKYLFANGYSSAIGNDSNTSVLYGNYNSAVSGSNDYDKNASNYVTKLENVYSNDDIKNYAMKNYDSIKDKLDTYTYTFEKKDGHFVITDFSVEHSK